MVAPAHVGAVALPPQKTASWVAEVLPSGRLSNPPLPNQDCIRVPALGGSNVVLGRAEWLSRDPIGEKGGLNLYGYVCNDPINAVDPLGLWAYFQPSTWFDGKGYQPGFHEDGVGQSAQAALDGLIPFIEPFAGGYDPCDKYNRMSRGGGQVAQTALTTAAGLGAVKALNGLMMPKTLYHFTSAEGAAGIMNTGGIAAGKGYYGTGVYLTGFNSASMATIQGAVSTHSTVIVATEGLAVSATYFPGTYIIRAASLLIR